MTSTPQTARGEDFIRSTCPRDCYDACGIRVVKRDGIVLRVMGDPDHPHNRGTLCGKCTLAYNGAWRDPAARLTRPLRRMGDKGCGQFAPISWDTALSEIAGRLTDIISSSGGDKIIQTHYTGTFSQIAYGFPLRFFHRIGATEVDPDTVCNKAGHVALGLTFGSSMDGFDPRTVRDSACVMVWGANPSASAPHAHRHWLSETTATVVVIDPIRHATAEMADIHLQPRPGTDAALAFSLLHVVARNGLVDKDFLANHTMGWPEVETLIEPCTPAWGESATGVPAELIEAAALAYGKGPSLLWLGQGLQRQANGGNVFRAVSLLPTATGNIGKPGAGFLYLNGAASRGIPDEFMPAPHLNRGQPKAISHMDLADCLEDVERSRALICWNNNIVASCPQQARLREALKREDLFTVAIDLFPTDTVDYADIVLPAASFLEFDDLVVSYFHYTVGAQVKAIKPIGESLPNQEIFRRLAAAMGFHEPELFETDESLLSSLMTFTGLGMTFAELAQKGSAFISPGPVIPFAECVFPTPSNKIEIAGKQFVDAGMPSAPQPWVDSKPVGDKLRLLSPASEWRMNSSYDNVDKARKRAGTADVLLNPAEAAARGLTDGMPVVLANETGRLALTVAFSDRVPPGVALVHKGRWPKLDTSGANVNVLNGGRRTDVGDSSAVHSVEVEILHAR